MTAADGTRQPARFSRTSKHRNAQLGDGSEVTLASSGERLGARVIDFGISAGFLWIGLWLSFASWDLDNTDEPFGNSLLFPLFPALQLVIVVVVSHRSDCRVLGPNAGKACVEHSSCGQQATGQRLRWRQSLGADCIIPLVWGFCLAGRPVSFWFVLSASSERAVQLYCRVLSRRRSRGHEPVLFVDHVACPATGLARPRCEDSGRQTALRLMPCSGTDAAAA